jgi:hypothetical protein
MYGLLQITVTFNDTYVMGNKPLQEAIMNT